MYVCINIAHIHTMTILKSLLLSLPVKNQETNAHLFLKFKINSYLYPNFASLFLGPDYVLILLV